MDISVHLSELVDGTLAGQQQSNCAEAILVVASSYQVRPGGFNAYSYHLNSCMKSVQSVLSETDLNRCGEARARVEVISWLD